MSKRELFNERGEFICGSHCLLAGNDGYCILIREPPFYCWCLKLHEGQPCACPEERERRLREQLGEER